MEVADLFEQFGNAESAQQQTVFDRIKQALTIHAQLEEKLVYPLLQEQDKKMAVDAQRDHDEMKELLGRVCKHQI